MSAETGSKVNVLVVEDNPQLRILYAAILGSFGSFQPIVTATPTECLAYFRSCRGTTHLVILDRDLPEMPGEIVAERMRQMTGSPVDPYILMISGGSPDEVLMRARGVNELMAKPFSPSSLITALTLANQRFQTP